MILILLKKRINTPPMYALRSNIKDPLLAAT
jgi:hypothetical protein